MTDSLSKRHMVENEVVFREFNERVKKGYDELKKLAKETGQFALVYEDDSDLLFYCECSDEDCQQRIKIAPSRFAEIHKQRDHFTLVNGHEELSIERIISRETDYCIVEKFMTPPESVLGLVKTDVNNT